MILELCAGHVREKDKYAMPWFVISYDFSPHALEKGQNFDGLALRYGWDKYRKSDSEFLMLPKHTLTGEFLDYTSARINFMQLCSEIYRQDHIVPINVVLMEISNWMIIADPSERMTSDPH